MAESHGRCEPLETCNDPASCSHVEVGATERLRMILQVVVDLLWKEEVMLQSTHMCVLNGRFQVPCLLGHWLAPKCATLLFSMFLELISRALLASCRCNQATLSLFLNPTSLAICGDLALWLVVLLAGDC